MDEPWAWDMTLSRHEYYFHVQKYFKQKTAFKPSYIYRIVCLARTYKESSYKADHCLKICVILKGFRKELFIKRAKLTDAFALSLIL